MVFAPTAVSLLSKVGTAAFLWLGCCGVSYAPSLDTKCSIPQMCFFLDARTMEAEDQTGISAAWLFQNSAPQEAQTQQGRSRRDGLMVWVHLLLAYQIPVS